MTSLVKQWADDRMVTGQDFGSAVNLAGAHLPFTCNIPYIKPKVWWSMWHQQVTSHQQGMLYTQMLKNIKSCLRLDSVTENPERRRALKAESRVCTIQCLRAFFVHRDPEGFSLILGSLTHPSLTLPWPPYSELSCTPCIPPPLAAALEVSLTEHTSHVPWVSCHTQTAKFRVFFVV